MKPLILSLILSTQALAALTGADVAQYVEPFAVWSGLPLVEVEAIAERDPDLLLPQSVQTENGFNPYTLEFDSVDALAASELTDGEVFKFLRYRREDLQVCFEDEIYNPVSRLCEVK